uniref:Uncharacterized protein n=1 Tax=Callorhinchus milii TaxID=7868 RepID=A0A4W3HBI4_CALMI
MLLSALGNRELPIPDHIDIYHLTREMAPSEKTPLACVMEVDKERVELEKEAERLAHEDSECEKLLQIYERLEELDADKAEVRASRILYGLGFTPAMQWKKMKDFSGGWRMRVALARYSVMTVSHTLCVTTMCQCSDCVLQGLWQCSDCV